MAEWGPVRFWLGAPGRRRLGVERHPDVTKRKGSRATAPSPPPENLITNVNAKPVPDINLTGRHSWTAQQMFVHACMGGLDFGEKSITSQS